MPKPDNTVSAWLLRAADNIQFCIAEHEAAEYVEAPSLHTVPMAAAHCKNVMFWRDKIIPVIDISLLAGKSTLAEKKYAMVIAYQTKDNMPIEHLAFFLAATPNRITVNDDDACELPESYPETLKPYVLSFFNHNKRVTSVFNIAQFSADGLA